MTVERRNYGTYEAQLWHLSEAAKRDIRGKVRKRLEKEIFLSYLCRS